MSEPCPCGPLKRGRLIEVRQDRGYIEAVGWAKMPLNGYFQVGAEVLYYECGPDRYIVSLALWKEGSRWAEEALDSFTAAPRHYPIMPIASHACIERKIGIIMPTGDGSMSWAVPTWARVVKPGNPMADHPADLSTTIPTWGSWGPLLQQHPLLAHYATGQDEEGKNYIAGVAIQNWRAVQAGDGAPLPILSGMLAFAGIGAGGMSAHLNVIAPFLQPDWEQGTPMPPQRFFWTHPSHPAGLEEELHSVAIAHSASPSTMAVKRFYEDGAVEVGSAEAGQFMFNPAADWEAEETWDFEGSVFIAAGERVRGPGWIPFWPTINTVQGDHGNTDTFIVQGDILLQVNGEIAFYLPDGHPWFSDPVGPRGDGPAGFIESITSLGGALFEIKTSLVREFTRDGVQVSFSHFWPYEENVKEFSCTDTISVKVKRAYLIYHRGVGNTIDYRHRRGYIFELTRDILIYSDAEHPGTGSTLTPIGNGGWSSLQAFRSGNDGKVIMISNGQTMPYGGEAGAFEGQLLAPMQQLVLTFLGEGPPIGPSSPLPNTELYNCIVPFSLEPGVGFNNPIRAYEGLVNFLGLTSPAFATDLERWAFEANRANPIIYEGEHGLLRNPIANEVADPGVWFGIPIMERFYAADALAVESSAGQREVYGLVLTDSQQMYVSKNSQLVYQASLWNFFPEAKTEEIQHALLGHANAPLYWPGRDSDVAREFHVLPHYNWLHPDWPFPTAMLGPFMARLAARDDKPNVMFAGDKPPIMLYARY